MSKAGNAWRRVHGRITKKPTNFSWLIEERLAGSGMPTTYDEFDWVVQQGVRAVVTMTENQLPDRWTSNVDYLHVPTQDLAAPSIDGIDAAVDFVHRHVSKDQPAMVHCAAGLGRAGTILACYLVRHKNYSAREAISEIRQKRPGSIQSDAQELAVSFYERHIRG